MSKKNGLPTRVYLKHGAYYFVDRENKWHRLAGERDGLPAMYRALATKTEQLKREGMMPQAVQVWLDNPRNRAKWGTKTRREYEAMGKVISEAFKQFHASEVTEADCDEFLSTWVERGQARMHNRMKNVLGQVLRQAALSRWRTGENPAKAVPGMSTEGRKQVVTDEDIARVKACAMIGKDGQPTDSGPALCKMIDLAMLTGQRIGDILKMRWQDVSADGLYVEQGKGRGRVRLLIQWTPALKAAIDACAEGTDKVGFLIKTSRKGKMAAGGSYTYWGMRSAWVRACERAGIDPKTLHIHDMRGRAGMDAAESADKIAAQHLLGHSSLKMTEHYIEGKTVKRVKPAK